MAMDPAAISASPPTKISRVDCTAPESPAANAKGTVRPSDMPMTTSRTKLPAVKCFSTCPLRTIASNLRVSFQVSLGTADHLPFALVGKLPSRLFQRHPESPLHFDAHVRSNFADLSRLVTQQIETDNLENPLLVCPGAYVNILDVRQLRDQFGGDPGLLAHFTDGGFRRLFTRVQ